MAKTAFLIFPHQLFSDFLNNHEDDVFVIEEWLFFKQYPFHKQKIVFHRASMRWFFDHLSNEKKTYIHNREEHSDVRKLCTWLKKEGFEKIKFFDPCDDWLVKRIQRSATENEMEIQMVVSPNFINSKDELHQYKLNSKRYFQTDFYILQRKKLNLLMQGDKPEGGKWSFDASNRKKYPKGKVPPNIQPLEICQYFQEAREYVNKYFPNNYGEIADQKIWAIHRNEAIQSLIDFLENRFAEFGLYEDAIVSDASFLNHSMLSPLINVGILNPLEVVHIIIEYAKENGVEINNTEGITRQIIGWREFVRYMYLNEGAFQRNRNFWDHQKPMPASFYDGSTGIKPVDDTIEKLIKTGYNHHIERLMILSNFMLLCEIHPNAVYQWFMEMYIDSYDWVMVPNVYGMGQFADGGLMCTKPYISGSNYVVKMSNYRKDPSWSEVWDALFWRFMIKHRNYFSKNPRLNMLLSSFDKREPSAQKEIFDRANQFLKQLHQE